MNRRRMIERALVARRCGLIDCGHYAIIAVGVVCGQVHSVEANAISIYDPGIPPAPGSGAAYVYGVSGDGSVAVGANLGDVQRAFQWGAGEGFTELELLGGFAESRAFAANVDGTVVVGEAIGSAGSRRAVRWTGDGVQDLGVLEAGDTSNALRVSSDGKAVVGTSGSQAFRWTESGGMQSLGSTSLSDTTGRDISHDGNVVVGYGTESGTSATVAFRWSAGDGGVTALEALPGAGSTYAFSVSGDGQYTFGHSYQGSLGVGVLWDSAGNIEEIGVLEGGKTTFLMAANADGSVVVGWDAFLLQAVLWTPSTGLVSLYDYLESSGADLTGWSRQDFQFAFDVSDDGGTIVGNGFVVTGLSFSAVPGSGVGVLLVMGCFSRRRRHPF